MKKALTAEYLKINDFASNMKMLFAVHTHHCLVTVAGQVMHYSCVQRGLLAVGQKPSSLSFAEHMETHC